MRTAQIRRPLFEVGALLDAKAMHGGRSGYNHLLCVAQSNGISRARVSECLELVGLERGRSKRARTLSLGMGQRLGIATALLGDPQVLLFDEPVNGLDPEGILWIRTLLRSLGARGSHGLRLEPPDERDGADGRPPRRDRPRPADRRLECTPI